MNPEMRSTQSPDVDMANTNNGGYGEELPLELCKLPSKGVLYPKTHPLHLQETVEFKAMTAHEENILATPALLKQGTVLNVLIRSCLMNKLIDPASLLIGDKAALLLSIRISGFDADYKAKTSCPSCNKTSVYEFNLNNSEIKPLGAKPVAPGKNLFEFILPKSNKKILFSLPTEGDDLEIMKIQDNRKKAYANALVDTTITDRLTLLIKSVDGSEDKEDIVKFINRMSVKDSRALRRYMAKIEPDMLMQEEVNCRHCGERSKRTIPVGYEFFWPQYTDE